MQVAGAEDGLLGAPDLEHRDVAATLCVVDDRVEQST